MLMFIEEDPEEMYTFLKDYAYVLTHTPVPPAGNIAIVGFSLNYMDLNTAKPVFGVSDKVTFKPGCSATENGYEIEISLVASLVMILSNNQITKVLIRLRRRAGWSAHLFLANLRRQVFSHRGPYTT